MALPRVFPLLRIVDRDTDVELDLRAPGVWSAVRLLPVSRFKLCAMPDGLRALREAQQGPLVILAVIGFGRVGKSTTLNAVLASLCECAIRMVTITRCSVGLDA